VEARIIFPNLSEELRQLVREEVQRAPEIGGAGGYMNVKSAAAYLDTSEDAISSMVRDGKLLPIRRRPYRLFTREELDRWVRDEAA
jgi:excisionase family DNA binding protein